MPLPSEHRKLFGTAVIYGSKRRGTPSEARREEPLHELVGGVCLCVRFERKEKQERKATFSSSGWMWISYVSNLLHD